MARSWLAQLNPFAWIQRWFTIAAFFWLAGTTFLLVLALTREEAKVSTFFALYLLLTVSCSAMAFVLYGVDKRRATNKGPRISERTLHLLSLLGGWPGAHLAQRFFRHKTLKFRFRLIFWLTVAAHLAIIAWGIWSGWPSAAITNLIGVSPSSKGDAQVLQQRVPALRGAGLSQPLFPTSGRDLGLRLPVSEVPVCLFASLAGSSDRERADDAFRVW